MKSLHELEAEDTEYREARANAEAEVARLLDRRKTLLLTELVDEVLALDNEINRQKVVSEMAQAKANELRGDIYVAREIAKQYAGVMMPTDDELERLLAIVTEAVDFPRLSGTPSRDVLDEFRRGFYACGRLGRLNEPATDRYFSSTLDDVSEILRDRRLRDVNGDVVLASALAWGDIVCRGADKDIGQMLEVSLAKRYTGTPPRPVWRDLLNGRANVQKPFPPRHLGASSSAYPIPRLTVRYGDGREADPSKNSWTQ
jgi:hypothetical protein